MKESSKPLFFSYTNDFLNIYLPLISYRSKHTIESYKDALTLFRRFLNGKGISQRNFLFEDCTTELINEFKSHLLNVENNFPSTVNGRVSAIRCYVDYAASRDTSLTSISVRLSTIRNVSVPKEEKLTLSQSQVTAIIAHIPSSRLGFRNKIMFLLLYESAIRVSELVSLKVQNIRMSEGTSCLYVVGKGKKERYIPILDSVTTLLNGYIRDYHELNDVEAPLFYGIHGGQKKPLTTRSVQMLLSKYASLARSSGNPDIPEHVHPHMLRRSKATSLYQTGTPLPLISSLLGHSQVETTRIYAKPSMEMKKAAMEKVVPISLRDEKPIWLNDEDDYARKNGLR